MSPIAGLTDVNRAFLKIGQIRKGEKDPETGAPRDLDYFRVTFHESEKECEAEFKHVYGEQPRSINIRLAFPNAVEVWDANYEAYAKGGLIAKASSVKNPETEEVILKWLFYRDYNGNKEVWVRNGFPVGNDGIEFMKHPIDLTKPVYTYKNRKGEMVDVLLEPVGRFQAVVPELARIGDAYHVGFLEFRATSSKDIQAISRELAAIDFMAKQVGKDITGIPMKLTRREEEITKNINGNLSRGPSWLVHIEVDGEWGGKALEYIERKALPEWVDAEVTELEPEPEEWDEGAFEAGVPEEPEPPKQSKAVPHPSQSRPFSPEALKDWFDERVKYHLNLKTNVNTNAGQVVAKMLNTTFGNDTDRYVFTNWLVGRASTKKLSGAEIRAMLDWMCVEKFEDVPVQVSIQEAKAALEFANALHGQLEF